MEAPFVFEIRPLTLDQGFSLNCEGIVEQPLHVNRLFEAVLAAAQLGQGLEAEIWIYAVDGEVAEVLEFGRQPAPVAARGAGRGQAEQHLAAA